MVLERRLGQTVFRDDILGFKDEADQSKLGKFQLSGITTATTRTLTWPDASGTIAVTSDLDAYLLADGTRALAGNWNLGGYNLTNGGDIGCGAITGTSLFLTGGWLAINDGVASNRALYAFYDDSEFGTCFMLNQDNECDLGNALYEFKDLYLDGTAYIDTLDADGGDIGVATCTTLNGVAIDDDDGWINMEVGATAWLQIKGTVEIDADSADGFHIDAGNTIERRLTVTTTDVALNQSLLTTNSPTFNALTVTTLNTYTFDQSVASGANVTLGTIGCGAVTSDSTGQFTYLGLGTAPVSTRALTARRTYTDLAGALFGMNFSPILDPAENSAASIYGIACYPQDTDDAFNKGALLSFFSQPIVKGQGTISSIYSYYSLPYLGDTSAGTITSLYHMGIADVSKHASSTTTITTLYGLYMAEQTKGATNWQIYSAGGDSYHAGDIILEDPTNKDVSIGSDAAGYLDLKAPTGVRIGGSVIDYSYISGVDAATNVTAAELEELTDGSSTALHVHKVPSYMMWYIYGDATVAQQQSVTLYPLKDFICTDVKMHADTGPAGSDLEVDIHDDGTTIFTTKPEIDDGQTTEDGNEAFSASPYTIAADSEVTFDIDQIGSGTAGANITITLRGYVEVYN